MPDSYLYVGEHADTLASGRPVAPGETVPADALNLDEDAGAPDQRFLTDRLLIEPLAPGSGTFDPRAASDDHLDAWLTSDQRPTVDQVVDAVAGDPAAAQRVLAAEQRTEQPRSTLVERLSVIAQTQEEVK